MSRIFCVLLLLCLPVVRADAQSDAPPKATRMDLPESFKLIDERTCYYGFYVEENKIGWMRETIRKNVFKGQPAYAFELETKHSLMSDGELIESTSVMMHYFSEVPPYAFLGGVESMQQGKFDNRVVIRAQGDKFSATLEAAGQKTIREVDALDYTLADEMTVEAWCLSNPQVGDVLYSREFDSEEMELTLGRYEMKSVVDEPDGTRYIVNFISEDKLESGVLRIDEKGSMIGGTLGGVFELKRETKEVAMTLPGGFDIFEAALLAIDEPLGNPSTVTELVLEVSGTGAEMIPSGGMQTVVYDKESKSARVTIVAGSAEREVATEKEIEESLESTLLVPSDSPKVKALALTAVDDGKSVRSKVRRLVNFVDRFIEDDMSAEPPTVLDLIETKRGDCTEHSDLFVTLARSLGIPARLANGFIYGEDSMLSFGGHAWCEVVVDGKWYPVDPTWGETMPNATHLRISSGKSGSNDMKVMFGGLKLKVISVKHRRGLF
jgi:hypothetical protein